MDRRVAAFGVAAAFLSGVVLLRFRGPSHAPPAAGDRPAGAEARLAPEVARVARDGRPVLFVGLDGADWELLDRYVGEGAMPNLAQLEQGGSAGVLETIHPPLSPLVWTSMMTGVSPIEHGILDFTRFNPATRYKEPITSDERRVPAIWNMATYGGKRVGTLGLWATYPAESVDGLMVSDRLFSFLYQEGTPPPGIVYPPSREPWAREALRRAERGVGWEELKTYLPWLEKAEYDRLAASEEPYAHPVSALRRILVETRVYHDLASDWVGRERPDLTIVYLQGTDSIGHVFAPYAPPRQVAVSEEDYRRYGQVPRLYFRYVDRLLGDYRRLAESRGAVLLLASDHGFRWSEGRPTALSSFAHATAAKWHRNEGIYLLWGPGVTAAPGHPGKAGVQQVCTTLLALLGLPSGKGVQGPPLPGVEPAQPAVDYAAHYRPATPAPAVAGSRVADDDALEKLKALGYIGGAEAGAAPQASQSGSTRTPGSYNNEGLILKAQGRTEPAIAAFEKALELEPNLASALWNLSDLLFAGERGLDRSDELLVRAFANGLPEGTKLLVGRAIGYQRTGKVERSLKLMSAAAAARPDEPEVWLFSGRYRVENGDCSHALADFEKAVRLAPRSAAAYASQAVARLCLGDRGGARKDLLRSLELDPRQPKVREYLRGL